MIVCNNLSSKDHGICSLGFLERLSTMAEGVGKDSRLEKNRGKHWNMSIN